ncbi:hypothetical protein FACS1894137_18430 [Spirochaetia bacterium]|nr:hypothetical protein FACS1894137_18430 [Spirochaetia bacterium]
MSASNRDVAILRTEAERNGLIFNQKYKFPALEKITRVLYDGGIHLALLRESASDMEGGIYVIQDALINTDGTEMSLQVSGYTKEESGHE